MTDHLTNLLKGMTDELTNLLKITTDQMTNLLRIIHSHRKKILRRPKRLLSMPRAKGSLSASRKSQGFNV